MGRSGICINFNGMEQMWIDKGKINTLKTFIRQPLSKPIKMPAYARATEAVRAGGRHRQMSRLPTAIINETLSTAGLVYDSVAYIGASKGGLGVRPPPEICSGRSGGPCPC